MSIGSYPKRPESSTLLGLVGLLCLLTSCKATIDDSAGFVLPTELRIAEWSEEAQGTLRAELEIPGVLLPTPLEVDLTHGRAHGSITIPNQDHGDKEVVVSYYARLNSLSDEVLVAESRKTITLLKDQISSIGQTTAVSDGSPLFDLNRNEYSNLDDIIRGVDPAPHPNPIVMSPQTVSFESGIPIGGFTRAFFVVSNTSDEPVLVDFSVQLAAAFTITPLEQVFEIGAGGPTQTSSIALGPNDDQVMAVTFAPTNEEFVIDAMEVAGVGQESGVQHGALMRLLGNPEGPIAQPPTDYEIPTVETGTVIGGYSGPVESYSSANLFSRAPAGIPSIDEQDYGSIGDVDIDAAQMVKVPAGYRFSLTLDGIDEDVDLHLFEVTLDDDGDFTVTDGDTEDEQDVSPVVSSSRGGASAEVIAFDATEITDRDTLLLIGIDRIEIELDEYENIAGALSYESETPTMQAAMRREPEGISIETLSECPSEYDSQAACSAADGGAQMLISGRNFDESFTVEVAGTTAVCAVLQPADFESDIEAERYDRITCMTPPASFNPRENPRATVVVHNPNGVATFPDALTYLPPRPVVYSVGPDRGPVDGGPTIVLNGDHFYGLDDNPPTVTFGDDPAQVIQVATDGSSIQVLLPDCSTCIGASTVDVTVTNPDRQSYTLVASFDYFQPLGPPPTIESIAPNSGFTTGGYDVVIRGDNFTSPMQVRLADSLSPVPQESVTLDVSGNLRVTMPAGPPRPVAVEVSNTDGQAARLADGFTYIQPPPAFNSITPTEGLIAGGTITVIIGQGFQPGIQVSFDDTPAAQVAYNSTSSLTVITPQFASERTVDLKLVNLDGQEFVANNAFTFINPTLPEPSLTGLAPASGPISGGTEVILTGANFQAGAQVFFGNVSSPSVSVASATEIITRTPPTNAGVVNVQVVNPDGQAATAQSAFAFVIPPPNISATVPVQGPIAGGTVVLIVGSGFREGAVVTFDGLEASSCSVNGSSTISCTSPPHDPGSVVVRVRNTDGQTATTSFTYVEPEFDPPNIFFLSPDHGTDLGGTPVEVHGTSFQDTSQVFFGSSEVEVVFRDLYDPAAQVLQVIAPPGQAGQVVSVRIQNADGQSAIAPFSYTAEEPPLTLSTIVPAQGPFDASMNVILVGQGFEIGASLAVTNEEFGFRADIDDMIWLSSSLLSATIPAFGSTEVDVDVDITLTNPDGESVMLQEGYRYLLPSAPSFSSIVQFETIEAGDECLWGGQRLLAGLDNGDGDGAAFDGILHPHEVDRQTIVCNPEPGLSAVMEVTSLADQPSCPQGGQRVLWGLDNNYNGLLDEGELTDSADFCGGDDGYNTLVSPVVEPNSENCPQGGWRLDIGLDIDRSGTIEDEEIESVSYVCNGEVYFVSTVESEDVCNGAGGVLLYSGRDDDGDGLITEDEAETTSVACNGPSGLHALTQTIPANSEQCPNGGHVYETGIDTNQDDALAADEVTFVHPICNGLDGRAAVATLTPVNTSPDCPDGVSGTEVTVGYDDDNSGELEGTEIASTSIVCDGLAGRDGYTTLVVLEALPLDDGRCPGTSGAGVEITQGLDTNEDGELSAEEVMGVEVLCGGEQGINSLIRTTRDDASCDGLGGFVIATGLDLDDDDVLADEEVLTSETLCNGEDGLTQLTVLDDASQEECEFGGTAISTGVDNNANASLELEEILASRVVCNGAPGEQAIIEFEPLTDLSICQGVSGRILRSGIDRDGDGQLSEEEVTRTEVICDGSQGLDSLLEVVPLGADDERCNEFGGTGFELFQGLDEDRDGTLNADERSHDFVVCDGAPGADGALSRVSLIDDPEACDGLGGIVVATGIDTNFDGLLDEDEVLETSTVCAGLEGSSSITATRPLDVSAEGCPNGGIELLVGVDTNANALLDEDEVDDSQQICNGIDGQRVLLDLEDVPSGQLCPTGGVALRSGIDLNGDESLTGEEVNIERTICNGVHGAATLFTHAPQGSTETCPSGGWLLSTGYDLDDDGALSGNEITENTEICHGTNGLDSLVQIDTIEPGIACATGGIEFRSGIDANSNGELDDLETSQSRIICNPEPPLQPLLELQPFEPNETCPAGGVTVVNGLDQDTDGLLSDNETTGTVSLCNGQDGSGALVESISLEPDPLVCPNGGIEMRTGTDLSQDGTLQEDEVLGSHVLCAGVAGDRGLDALVEMTPTTEEESNCPTGGVRLDSGNDTNQNGVLEAEEVSTSREVCNGNDGEPVSWLSETLEPNEFCPEGGQTVVAWLDLNTDATLTRPDEVLSETQLCHGSPGEAGLSALISQAPLEAGNTCTYGGVEIASGRDLNGNQTLDADEVTSLEAVCAPGPATSSLVAVHTLDAGADCLEGGLTIDTGLDQNFNGVLDNDEVTGSQILCNGQSGTTGTSTLIEQVDLEVGSDPCDHGGILIRTGVDADASGDLAENEVTSTSQVCNLAPVANAIVSTSVVEPGESCPEGGVLIETGNDVDLSGVLDAQEVQSSQVICNGQSGSSGVSNLTEQIVLDAGDPTCPDGGIRIISGQDLDDSGVLEPEEILSTNEVCNSAPTQPALINTTALPADEACPEGGTLLETGIDRNLNGSLDPEEILSSSTLCHGLSGTPGAGSLVVQNILVDGDPTCPHGGTELLTGLDSDESGTLDPEEIEGQSFLCNPESSSGLILSQETIPEGSVDCPGGGNRLIAGFDHDESGILDETEVTTSTILCDGITSPQVLTLTESLSGQSVLPGGGILLLGDEGIILFDPQRETSTEISDEPQLSGAILGLGDGDLNVLSADSSPAVTITHVRFNTDRLEATISNTTLTAEEPDAQNNLPQVIVSKPVYPDWSESILALGGPTAILSQSDIVGGSLLSSDASVETSITNPLVVDIIELPDGETGILATTGSTESEAIHWLVGPSLTDISAAIPAMLRGNQDVLVVTSGDINGEPGDEIFIGRSGLADLIVNVAENYSLTTTALNTSDTLDAAIVDLNGDGYIELITCRPDDTPSLSVKTISPESLVMSNPAFNLGALASANCEGITTQDFDGDGTLDVATINASDGNLTVYSNDGDGGFTAAMTETIPDSVRTALAFPIPNPCVDGGIRLTTGTDTSGNGNLEDDEVAQSTTVCSGTAGQELMVETRTDDGACSDGGVLLVLGYDDNGNGGLDESEYTTTVPICDASRSYQALVNTEALPVDNTHCPHGGFAISSGIDYDQDTTLDESEVTQVTYSCFPDAADTTSLIRFVEVQAGAECPNGGQRIEAGFDNGTSGSGNGVLDDDEVLQSALICHPGAEDPSTSPYVEAIQPGGISAEGGQLLYIHGNNLMTAEGILPTVTLAGQAVEVLAESTPTLLLVESVAAPRPASTEPGTSYGNQVARLQVFRGDGTSATAYLYYIDWYCDVPDFDDGGCPEGFHCYSGRCMITSDQDGVIENPERCDGDNLDGHTCSTLGFTGGTLACSEAGNFDISGCEGQLYVGAEGIALLPESCTSGDFIATDATGSTVCIQPAPASCTEDTMLSPCNLTADDITVNGICFGADASSIACRPSCTTKTGSSSEESISTSCANPLSMCIPTGVVGKADTTGVCLEDTTFPLADGCPSGMRAIVNHTGKGYACISPSLIECTTADIADDGVANASNLGTACSYEHDGYQIDGACFGQIQGDMLCVAECTGSVLNGEGSIVAGQPCANDKSMCQLTDIIGRNDSKGYCLPEWVFMTAADCTSGFFTAASNGSYACTPPSAIECNLNDLADDAELNGSNSGESCNFEHDATVYSGLCHGPPGNQVCLAACGLADKTLSSLYNAGPPVCDNPHSYCQPVGVAGANAYGICLPENLTCTAEGTDDDSKCVNGTFGCDAGICAVASTTSCLSGDYACASNPEINCTFGVGSECQDGAGDCIVEKFFDNGDPCTVDRNRNGASDEGEGGFCVPVQPGGTVLACAADCSDSPCVATSGSGTSLCTLIEPVGSGTLEDPIRNDHAVCVNQAHACSTDADCFAAYFIGCDTTLGVCEAPSLLPCRSNAFEAAGSSAAGTPCDTNDDAVNDGYCIPTEDSDDDGVKDTRMACHVSCNPNAETNTCTTRDATCVDISNGDGIGVCSWVDPLDSLVTATILDRWENDVPTDSGLNSLQNYTTYTHEAPVVFTMTTGNYLFYGSFEIQRAGVARLTIDTGVAFDLTSFQLDHIEDNTPPEYCGNWSWDHNAGGWLEMYSGQFSETDPEGCTRPMSPSLIIKSSAGDEITYTSEGGQTGVLTLNWHNVEWVTFESVNAKVHTRAFTVTYQGL